MLALYLRVLVWGLVIARNSKDGFGAMLAVGMVGLLFWPPCINVAMVLGLAPVIGVPLPLFSYGGSALLAALVGLGPAAERLDAPLHVLAFGLPCAPTRRAGPRIGAFFDMDKTLIAENSGALFMRYRYERAKIGGWDLLKGFAAYLRYKIGMLDIRAWTEDAMEQFAGESERELDAEAHDWFEERVAPTIYPEAREVVRKHEAGHVVAIVSGATKYVVQSARRAARHQAHALHAPRGRARPLHGPRDRADLLRGGQDLLAPAAHRGGAGSTSRRAGSTPTR